MAEAELVIVSITGSDRPLVLSRDKAAAWMESYTEVMRIILDRIYIADAIGELHVISRWLTATKQYERDYDAAAATSRFTEIRQSLVQEATKC